LATFCKAAHNTFGKLSGIVVANLRFHLPSISAMAVTAQSLPDILC